VCNSPESIIHSFHARFTSLVGCNLIILILEQVYILYFIYNDYVFKAKKAEDKKMKKLKKLKDKRHEEGIESFESSNELYASVHKSTLHQ